MRCCIPADRVGRPSAPLAATSAAREADAERADRIGDRRERGTVNSPASRPAELESGSRRPPLDIRRRKTACGVRRRHYDAPCLSEIFLRQRPADALHHAALDLPLDIGRMQRAADIRAVRSTRTMPRSTSTSTSRNAWRSRGPPVVLSCTWPRSAAHLDSFSAVEKSRRNTGTLSPAAGYAVLTSPPRRRSSRSSRGPELSRRPSRRRRRHLARQRSRGCRQPVRKPIVTDVADDVDARWSIPISRRPVAMDARLPPTSVHPVVATYHLSDQPPEPVL